MTSTKEYVKRDEGLRSLSRKRQKGRCRKRLSTLLHTHVALILVCTLAALDSACVIGQIICDILIMKESLGEWEDLDANLSSLLVGELPILNASYHSPGSLDLDHIQDILWQHHQQQMARANFTAQVSGMGVLNLQPNVQARAMGGGGFMGGGIGLGGGGGGGGFDPLDPRLLQVLQTAAANAVLTNGQSSGTVNVTLPLAQHGDLAASSGPGGNETGEMLIGFFKIPVRAASTAHRRVRRAAGGEEAEDHGLLHELTHAFHLGSMIILSILLLETLLKVFSMGKKILHHKLEIFDAFVVSVSWALDVAFWEGIWAHPGTEAATILIFILPWRVVRIVNSFVLVIQEKDHVQLKIVKQRLRLSVKKSKESTRKVGSYRTEVKQLQGLCRKYGAIETEIQACGPPGRQGRRRSSLMPAMERAASLTLISALGSHPSLYTMGSSSEDEADDLNDRTSRELTRTVSADPTLRSAFSVSTLDSVFTIEGKRQGGDLGYNTSDTEDNDKNSVNGGLHNPVFVGDNDLPLANSSPYHPADVIKAKDAEAGQGQGQGQGRGLTLAQRLHARLTEQTSDVTVVSETSISSGGASDPAQHEVPPHYHEVVSQQDSHTRL